jgi:hypothetical protein
MTAPDPWAVLREFRETLEAEQPREPEASLGFASRHKRNTHVLKHVLDGHRWWTRRFPGEERAAAMQEWMEARADRPAFERIAREYERILVERALAASKDGVRHGHWFKVDVDEGPDLGFSGGLQMIGVWDPDGNLLIWMNSAVTPEGARPYSLRTGFCTHPEMDRGVFLKRMRRKLEDRADERGHRELAMHD